MISGAAIPTERAFVMNGIVFAAILIDRLRLSMRICALAAMVVLVLDPASLVGVSFQMSFGAVVALIAVYETWGAQLARMFHRGSFGRKVLGYCGAVAVTTVVATIGTEPFSIYHFHQLVLYSPLANVIAVPISAMWTLPWGVVACLLMPFGLERLALVPMGWGIDATIWVAAACRGAARQCLGDAAPADCRGWCWSRSAGCGCACGRAMAATGASSAIVAGLATMLLTRPPDIVLADLGRFLAVRAARTATTTSPTAPRTIDRSFFGSGDRRATCCPGRPGTPATCSTARPGAALTPRAASASRSSPTTPGCRSICDTVDAIVAQVPAGLRVPRANPGRRPHRHLARWRRRAVAERGRRHDGKRQPAAATAPGSRTRSRARGTGRRPRNRPLKPPD